MSHRFTSFPHDINLIQAHKALDMAALACKDGGTIILLAECTEGLGRSDFLKWFDASDSRALEARLRNGYESMARQRGRCWRRLNVIAFVWFQNFHAPM